MNETFTNVAGPSEVLERLVHCWASRYGERIVACRGGQGRGARP